jgi:hypothetical protein
MCVSSFLDAGAFLNPGVAGIHIFQQILICDDLLRDIHSDSCNDGSDHDGMLWVVKLPQKAIMKQ